MLSHLKNPFDSLNSEAKYFSTIAFNEDENWEYLNEKIKALENISLSDVQTISKVIFSNLNKKRIAVLGRGNSQENKESTYKKIS